MLDEVRAAGVLARAGMLPLGRPDHLAGMLGAMRGFGQVGAIPRIGAIRDGTAIAVDDELGTLTYAQLDARSDALARALVSRGLGAGDGVAIMCRNHRLLLDATFAAVKVGCRAILLGSDFAGPQLAQVVERERAAVLVYDDEFAGATAEVRRGLQAVRAFTESADGDEPTVEELISSADGARSAPPAQPGRVVILTSGTSGVPKGAARAQPRTLTAPAALLSKLPYRRDGVVFLAPPLYHSWGFINASLTLGLGARLVLRRRFDAAGTLDALESARCTALVVVPVMLRRLLALGADEIRRRDLSALRIVACGGARLPVDVAAQTLDTIGDVLYDVYGSTEVAQATVATPSDLRAAPGCVGRPPLGTIVKVLDEHGHELPAGRSGRIFVANAVQSEGYTGGGRKDVVDGMMATGDVGRFDAAGRLFVEGRDDEMVISGAENVYPGEVEDVLARHGAIEEAAVVGVPDDEFGQRLRAYVVAAPGAQLTADDVREHVRDRLARFKVPRDVVFVDSLPRNPSGKILKRELGAAAPSA